MKTILTNPRYWYATEIVLVQIIYHACQSLELDKYIYIFTMIICLFPAFLVDKNCFQQIKITFLSW